MATQWYVTHPASDLLDFEVASSPFSFACPVVSSSLLSSPLFFLPLQMVLLVAVFWLVFLPWPAQPCSASMLL
jgi:hypothetical protein